LVLSQDGPNAAVAAENHFQKSLEWARRQGTLSWELRGATSLARLWHRQRKTSEARKLLASVYRRFTEGFDTADLIAAKALLASFR
jgi:predicted ATPase